MARHEEVSAGGHETATGFVVLFRALNSCGLVILERHAER
jgi:hypothetical protein